MEWRIAAGGKLYISGAGLEGWGLQAGLINKGNACGNVRKCETFVTTLKCLCIASISNEIIELQPKFPTFSGVSSFHFRHSNQKL